MTRTLVNSLGLLSDVVGVVLLYFYGLPTEISRSGAIRFIAEQTDTEELRLTRRYDRWARVGLACLLLGFLLQLVSNFVK